MCQYSTLPESTAQKRAVRSRCAQGEHENSIYKGVHVKEECFSLLHSTRLEGVRLPLGGKILLEKERRRGGLHEESVRTATRRKRKKNSWVEEARVLAAHFIGPAHLVPLVEVRWQRRPSSREERNDPRSRGSRYRKFANVSGRGSKKGAHLKVTIGNSELFSPCAVSF